MIGYCLKNTGKASFAHAMFNVSNVDMIAGKTFHAMYDRVDLKSRVTLTNKNVSRRILLWMTFLNMLTNLVKSRLFIPMTS